MRGALGAALVACAILGLVLGHAGPAFGQAGGEPVKPYILFIVDVSGSMDGSTGAGDPSCTSGDSRINHAKCAIQNIVNGYGEMTMGLGRFRLTTSDSNPSNGCSLSGIGCSNCDDFGGSYCTPTMIGGDRLEVLVPIVDGNTSDLLSWVDFSTGTCYADNTSDPELGTAGWTPLAGSLAGARRYFQGLDTPGLGSDTVQPYWTGPGDDPIRDDPLKDVFAGGEQCRPYVVVLLTDGDETCTDDFGDTTSAAASLLSTPVDGQSYRIVTRPIGFGKNPGDSEIEAIAHAGGTPDVGGQNEGLYAQNEEELSIAMSQIIADNLKFEVCNDLDDDCDLLIDENFPDKGTVCNDGGLGVCRGTGVFVCNAGGTGVTCQITDPGDAPGAETCNSLDDDCDGKIDEDSVCVGCGDTEICDNMDNDCDGDVDEDLVRPCGTDLGICTAGTEECIAGQWENCDATGGTGESCNGLDDDCDGTIDGFGVECVEIPGNNPGVGECQAGTEVCPADGSGEFGPCLGEIGPTTEACDTLDNDCDGDVDEDTGGADCSSSCGVGTTVCENGTLVCEGSDTPSPEECNGFDDDCDGVADEGIGPMGPCDEGGTLCVPGELQCIGGGWQCVGGEAPGVEICDCEDNDCDTEIDEEPPALCAPGASCVACQCAFPCGDGEFPCPLGKVCVDDFCLVDPCFGVTCAADQNGDRTECVDGDCVRSCDLVTCPGDLVCRGSDGQCVPDDCSAFPEYCADSELCIGGACVADPCTGVACGDGEYCVGGDCVASCADVTCPAGERCRKGTCEADPCGGPCGAFQVCDEDTGSCVQNPCLGRQCPGGDWCNPQTGQCEADQCVGVECPGAGQVCVDGSCYRPDQLEPQPDAGPGPTVDYVTPGGGGGCSSGGGGSLALGLVLGLLLAWRRRAEVRS